MSAPRLAVVPRNLDPGGGAPVPKSAVDAAWTTRTGAIGFSETVRCVVALSRRGGLAVPVFRSPPGRTGVDRTIRRRGDQPPVVAIARAGRPLAAVQSDVIEALVVVNRLDDRRADRFRRAAWGELERAGLTPEHLAGRVVAGAGAGDGRLGHRPSRVEVTPVRGERTCAVPNDEATGEPARVAS